MANIKRPMMFVNARDGPQAPIMLFASMYSWLGWQKSHQSTLYYFSIGKPEDSSAFHSLSFPCGSSSATDLLFERFRCCLSPVVAAPSTPSLWSILTAMLKQLMLVVLLSPHRSESLLSPTAVTTPARLQPKATNFKVSINVQLFFPTSSSQINNDEGNELGENQPNTNQTPSSTMHRFGTMP